MTNFQFSNRRFSNRTFSAIYFLNFDGTRIYTLFILETDSSLSGWIDKFQNHGNLAEALQVILGHWFFLTHTMLSRGS